MTTMNAQTASQPAGKRKQSGQIMPIAAISMLILALMVFFGLNIERAVHERIRLQNYTDSQAYSLAVQEARTFNYFAYSNRALASAYVSMATMHAYMSEAAMIADLDFAMCECFGEIAGIEAGLSAACFAAWDIEGGIEHAIHAVEAGINAGWFIAKWAMRGGTPGEKVRALDSPFDTYMSAVKAHIDLIKASQTVIYAATYALLTGVTKIDNLQDNNMGAKTASNAVGMLVPNGVNFYQAVNLTSSDDEKAKKIMTNVSNGSRPGWTWDRKGIEAPVISAVMFADVMSLAKDDCLISSDDITIVSVLQAPDVVPVFAPGRTGFSDDGIFTYIGGIGFDTTDNGASDLCGGTNRGASLNSWDWSSVEAQWKHGLGVGMIPMLGMVAPGMITTGKSNGHGNNCFTSTTCITIASPHDSTNHGSPDAVIQGGFYDYKGSDSTSAIMNQPKVYAGATADSRTNDYNLHGPWEINMDDQAISLSGGGVDGSVKLTGSGDHTGKSISKAQVYYHRLGDWKEQPNFFNPFWRAKLDSTTLIDLGLLYTMSGNPTDGVLAAQLCIPLSGACNLK